MAENEAEVIAEGLSPAQRNLIARHHNGVLTNAFYMGREHRACRTLVAAGLLSETQDSVGNPMARFTALGLEVRSHLRNDPPHKRDGI